ILGRIVADAPRGTVEAEGASLAVRAAAHTVRIVVRLTAVADVHDHRVALVGVRMRAAPRIAGVESAESIERHSGRAASADECEGGREREDRKRTHAPSYCAPSTSGKTLRLRTATALRASSRGARRD